jgi:hypothetical protein
MPHCIDSNTLDLTKMKTFDGKNWEQSMQEQTHLPDFSQKK